MRNGQQQGEEHGTSELHRHRTMHLFAGAGGGILADILRGYQPVCAVEINPYCQQVLAARQEDGSLPWFPIYDDVTKFAGDEWRGLVDGIAAGFPCQDISAAGKGAGIDGERSGLWGDVFRLIRAIRPRFVELENSPMLTSRGLGRVLGDLASLGYDAEWGVLGSAALGMDIERERIWIAASAPGVGRPEVVRREQRKRIEAPQGRAANDDDSRSRLDRIRALEQVVAEPAIFGSSDGLAYQVDRLKAAGNGQVPVLAATAFRMLRP